MPKGGSFHLPLTPLKSDAVLGFIPAIKYLRNSLEHPATFLKPLNGFPASTQEKWLILLNHQTLAPKILGGVIRDLISLKGHLQQRIQELASILQATNVDENFLEDILVTEFSPKQETGTQPGAVSGKYAELKKQAHWQDNELGCIQWLRRYFYHPSYPLHDPEGEDLNQVAHHVAKHEKNSSRKLVKEASLPKVLADINELSQFVRRYSNRNDFITALHKDRKVYAYVVNLVTQIYLQFNTLIEGHNLSFYEKMSSNNQKLFEIIFNDLRERRNFSIHDLWRKDLRGLAKISYHLTYNLFPILSSSQPTPPNEATEKMWQAIYDQEITPELLEELVGEGADVNAPDSTSWPPLAYIINQSDEYEDSLVDAFLAYGADPNRCNDEGDYPIHIAAEDTRFDCINALVDAGAIVDPKNIWGKTPEDTASDAGYEDVRSYLQGMASRFRGDKADKLHRNLDPLWFNEEYVVNPLKARELNLFNAEGELPLILAIEKSTSDNQEGVLKVVRTLVKRGADVNKQQVIGGLTPLIAAVRSSSDFQLLCYLLKKGAKVNEIDTYGWSALHHASLSNNHEFVKILLSSGADRHLKDRDRRTPLLLNLNSAKGGDFDTVRLLLEGDSAMDTTTDNNGKNALKYATTSNRKDIITLINSVSNGERT